MNQSKSTKTEPVKAEPVKAEPVKAEPAKAEPVKAEPAKAEPVKAEPVKAEPVKAEPAKAEPAKAEPVKAEPVKINALVTDDNYFNRDIFRVALEDAGFIVEEAPNGKTCLALLEKQQFDLLILDLQMPGMNGVEILREIDTKKSKGNMSILVITANPHMVTEEVEAKADFTMQKPVDVVAFSTFTKRLIDQRRTNEG